MSENKISYFKHNNMLALKFSSDKRLSGYLYHRGYRFNKEFKHWEIFLHERELSFLFKKLGHWKRSPSAQDLFNKNKKILRSIQLKQIGNPNGFIISDFCDCFKSTYIQCSDLSAITKVLSLKHQELCLITEPQNKKNPDYCPEAKVFSYNEIDKIPSNSVVIVDEIYNFQSTQKRSAKLIKNSSRFDKIILMSQKEFNKLELAVIVLLQLLDEKLDKDRIVNKYVHSLSTSKHIQINAILYKKIFLDYSYKIILQNSKK